MGRTADHIFRCRIHDEYLTMKASTASMKTMMMKEAGLNVNH